MSSTPDHVYLDLSTVNNDILGTDNRPLNFTESRTNPIIDNPSNYYMSVIRFEVDTPAASLPIFIPKLLIDGSNTDKNTTAYSITMARPNLATGLLDDVVQRYVEWSPQEKVAALPNNQYANTGVVSTTLPATIFRADNYPTSTVILPTLQDDVAKPTYQYAGSPVTALTSYVPIDSTQAKFHWTSPQPAGLTCSFSVGIFQSSVPILAGFSAGFLQAALFYTIGGVGPQLDATLDVTAVTEIVTPSSVGNVYSYLIVADVEDVADPLGPDVVVNNISINNLSLTQFQGSVPRILSSTFLGPTVINTQDFYNFQLVMDKNYFNLPPTPSSNQSLEVLTASMVYARTNYANLEPDFLNYRLTDWTFSGDTPVTVADIAANYLITAATTCSYNMVLNDSEQSPVYMTTEAGDSRVYLAFDVLNASNPGDNVDLKFLTGSAVTFSVDGILQLTGTVEFATLEPELVPIVGVENPCYLMVLQLDSVIENDFLYEPLKVCSFTFCDATVLEDNQISLPTAPPSNPTVIRLEGDDLYITDYVASHATFFGYLPSAYTSTGTNLNIFTLTTAVTLTPEPHFTTESVQYTSIAMSVKPIAPTISTQDITTGYYNCYNVKWWLNCVNKTLADLWNDIGGLVNYAPQMVVDSNSNLITLMTPYDTDAGADPSNFAVSDNVASTASYLGTGSEPAVNYSMFFNEPMYNLFSSLSSIHYGSTTIGNAQLSAGSQAVVAGNFSIFAYYVQVINFNFKNYIETNSSLITVPQHWFLTESEYSPVPMWSPISSLIFSTSFLPVQMSLTTTPNVFGNNPYDKTFVGGSIGNNSQITTMISDIQVPLTTGSEYKPTVLYAPGAEYRLIDLLGNTPINQASFSIAYKTKFGDVIPFSLGSLCGANLKILFRRRRFNLGNVAPFDTN